MAEKVTFQYTDGPKVSYNPAIAKIMVKRKLGKIVKEDVEPDKDPDSQKED